MTDILPPAGWLNVRQLETNEFATGGANGNMNEQAKSLAARSELLKQYASLPYESKTGGYALNERVQLDNGDIVKSTVNGNTNNPNLDMTGWVKPNSASQIFDASGKTQQEINNRFKDNSLNLDYFKTASNTDTDAYKLAIDYCEANNIKLLNVTRNTEINDRLYISQNDFTVDFNNTTVTWSGVGQNSLKFSAFNLVGSLTSDTTAVLESTAAYQNNFKVSNATIFSVGDDILIKSTSIISPMIYLNHCVRIVAISGNSITVDTVIRLPLDLSYGAINVTKVNTIKNSSVLNLKFTAKNQNSRSDGITGVYFENTFGCSASVSCTGLYFKGLKVNNSNGFVMLGGRGDKPAATGGGEGYGFQFEYCVNSKAYGLIAYNMRHCLDVTASWGIYAKDCFDYYSMSSSFGTHKAFEYDVTFENCHSIASNEHGFYFGSAAPLFGQTADKIKMKNCSVLRSKNICVAYTTLGKGLIIEDCMLDPIAAVGIYSAVIANNDVEFIRTKTTSGISIVGTATENAYTAGFCKFSSSDINANASVARSLTIGVGASVEFNGGVLGGTVNARSNTSLTLTQCDWFTPSIMGWLDAAQDGTQVISLDNVKLKASHAAVPAYTYNWKVKSLRFNNVEFDVAASIANKHKMSNVDTVIKNSFGAVSMILDGTSATRFAITNNDFGAIAANEIISSDSAYPLTCPVDIDDNVFKATSNANSAIVIGTTGANVSRLSVQRNSGVGRIRVGSANVTKCIIMGNNCDGAHLLPTHDTTNRVVQFNL